MALYTVKQICKRHPGITVGKIRWWIYRSKDRHIKIAGRRGLFPGNGFAKAVKRAGGRVLIDEELMLAWMSQPSS